MTIHTFQYRPEDVSCTLCTEYSQKEGCTADVCPWLSERIAAGAAGYQEAIMEMLPRSAHMDTRLRTAVRRFTGSLFLTPAHRQRMKQARVQQGIRRKRDTPAYFAALFLLTANEELYERTASCFCKHHIEFSRAVLRNISPHNFTLFSAARDIYCDSSGLTVSDLANSEVVDTLAFSLIVNAMLIARYGCTALKITDREGKT